MGRLERRYGKIVVYTDGACSNNGRSGAVAGIGVYWSHNHPDNVSRLLDDDPATNQRAEIHAAIEALKIANSNGYRRLLIVTDSKYLINGATRWIEKWRRNGWINCKERLVCNREDWKKLLHEMKQIDELDWEHVAAHRDNYGNTQADRLAREAIDF